MTISTKDELVAQAVSWVREKSPVAEAADAPIDGAMDLFAAGLLDSVGFVELVAFIEEQAGGQIDLAEVDPEEFMTIQGLCRHVTLG